MLISITTRSIFLTLTHPISFVITILIQSITVCLIIFLSTNTSWFSVMLFLIFMGGLIILFIYIARLASNEKFEFSLKTITYLTLISLTLILILLHSLFNKSITYESINFRLFINIIYALNILIPTALTILFLLLTLLITVNIVKIYESPIRALI